MSNFLNLYNKNKKGGVATKSKKSKLTKESHMTRAHSVIRNDITDDDVETIQKIVVKLRDDLNLQLIDSFDYKCYDYILELDDKIKRRKIDDSSVHRNINDVTFYSKYLDIYDSPEKKDVVELLKKSYQSYPIAYKKIKCYLDGYDIIHDVRSVSGYIDKLKEIYKKYDTTMSFVVITNDHKLSQERNKMIEQFKNELTVSVSTENDEDLTEMKGYSTFFNEIIQIGDFNNQFIYRESGRSLLHSDLIKYVKSLANKEEFKKLCIGTDSKLTREYDNMFTSSNETIHDFEIPTDSISSFDACTKKINGSKTTDIQIFKDIYSFYDYHILSNIHESNGCNIPVHVVAVTTNVINEETSNKKDTNQLKAFFLIQGEPSINFLVEQSNTIFSDELQYKNVPIPRKSKKRVDDDDDDDDNTVGGSKKKASNIVPITETNTGKQEYKTKSKPYLIQNMKLMCGNNQIEETTNIQNYIEILISDSFNLTSSSPSLSFTAEITELKEKGYFFNESINWNEKQLILFGIKTVGDLMFTCNNYKDKIKLLSTTDSFIKASVLYNYLSGNSPILQSVWRKDKDKGWIYSKGILSNSADDQTKQLLVKFASILGFIKNYTVMNDVEMNTINQLNNLRDVILRNIFEPDTSDNFITMINEHSTLKFDRIANCLRYISDLNNIPHLNQIKNKIKDDMLLLENMYDGLSYAVLHHEIKYKYDVIIPNYVRELCKINEPTLISSIEKMSRLSSIFYLNTISLYENNASDITSDNTPAIKDIIVAINPRTPRSTRTAYPPIPPPRKHYDIFYVDPKLEKVIIKENVIEIEKESHEKPKKIKAEAININISNDAKKSIRLILKNDIINKKDGSIVQVSDNAYKKGTPRTISNVDPSYIINKTQNKFDKDIYYTLINDTLNYEELEILLFSSINLNDKYEKNTQILSLGKYIITDDQFIYVYLWKVPNKIGNLFKLLTFNSINDNTLSTCLILTRILMHFKYILMDYTNYTEKTSDVVISEYIKTVNSESIKKIIINLIGLKMNEISIYNNVKMLFRPPIESSSMEVVGSIKNDTNLEELKDMNYDMYDEVVSAINEHSKIDEIIKKIELEIYKCNEVIQNLSSSQQIDDNIEVMQNLSSSQQTDDDSEVAIESGSESEDQIGGINYELMQKYIIKTYLHENYRNKFLFDGPADDDDIILEEEEEEEEVEVKEVEVKETSPKFFKQPSLYEMLTEQRNQSKKRKSYNEIQYNNKRQRVDPIDRSIVGLFGGGKKTKRQNTTINQKNKKTRRNNKK